MKSHFGQNEGVLLPIPSSPKHPKKAKEFCLLVVQKKNWILHNPKSYEGLIQKLVRAFIFKPLGLRPCPLWYVKRPIWRFPKWYGNGQNSQKWARQDAIFEASFSALTQGNFKDDQNLDFLHHPNGQNHIVGSQWDGLRPLSWKILVLGVRPILSLHTSLKWATYKAFLAVFWIMQF